MDGDDVYNSDYKLTPLQKLEKYMQSENVYTRSVQCPELDFVNLKTLYLECNLYVFSNVSLLGKWWHVDFLTHCGQWKRWKKMCFQSSTPWSNFHKTQVSRIVVFFVNFLYCIRINITAF